MRVIGLAVAVGLLYVLPWPRGLRGSPFDPTVMAVVFTLLACMLRVDTWRLVLAFPLVPFVLSAIGLYASGVRSDVGSDSPAFIALAAWAGALLLAPLTLLAPLLGVSVAYALVRGLRRRRQERGEL